MSGIFDSGAKVLPDLIDDIANRLISSSSEWVDGDTTWDTTDRSGTNARRCLKYTGDDSDIYIALESINDHYLIDNNAKYAKGLKITFAGSWDSTNHIYTDGYDDFYSFIQFQSKNVPAFDFPSDEINADMASLQLMYYLWVDATGFVLYAEPEPNGDSQGAFIVTVEHFNAKEYNDGHSNFYLYAWTNGSRAANNGKHKFRSRLRPFTCVGDPAYAESDAAQFSAVDNWGIQFWKENTLGRYSFKNYANGKAYFVKPIVCNTTDNMTPIGVANLFWKYSENAGLIDGDVVALQGSTTKYLLKGISGPDSGSRLTYAIKYQD